MRLLPAALSLLLVAPWQLAWASPLLRNETIEIEKRCSNPCGYQGWLCCNDDQHCSYLSDGEPFCANGAGASEAPTPPPGWPTSTGSPVTPTEGTCRADIGETPCGGRCCEAAAECVNNQCVQASSSAPVPTPGGETPTESPSPTNTGEGGGGGGTEPNSSPSSSSITSGARGSGTDLSGGAIAGIVVGCIAGLFLLGFLLFCMRGRRRGGESVYVEKRRDDRRRYTGYTGDTRDRSYYRTGMAPWRRTWFGTRPSTVVNSGGRRGGSGPGVWASIGVFLAALAVCFGLKRRDDRRRGRRGRRGSVTDTSYTYTTTDYYTNTACKYFLPKSVF